MPRCEHSSSTIIRMSESNPSRGHCATCLTCLLNRTLNTVGASSGKGPTVAFGAIGRWDLTHSIRDDVFLRWQAVPQGWTCQQLQRKACRVSHLVLSPRRVHEQDSDWHREALTLAPMLVVLKELGGTHTCIRLLSLGSVAAHDVDGERRHARIAHIAPNSMTVQAPNVVRRRFIRLPNSCPSWDF